MSKGRNRFTHWSCPHCQVIIPNYKDRWESMEVKIRNHLLKFHSDEYSRNQADALVHSLWLEFQEVKQS